MEGYPTNNYNSTSYNRFNFARTAQNFRAQARSDNLLLVILFGIFVFVLVYLLILYNRPSLLNYTLIPTPIKLDKNEINPLPNSDKLPSLTNGREYAYSFWLYLESVKKNNNYNLVLLRTPNSDSNFLQNANPIIYFDKNSNKLVIKVRTSLADRITFNNLDSIIEGEGTDNEVSMHNDNCKYATFKIDYVPLQRWVNIIVNVNNNMLSVIMDGAIHSTRILNENNLKCTEDASSNLVSPTAGTLMIGNINEDINILPAADGYISRIQFFNYSLKTPVHIKKIYNSGPVKSVGILQKLGLPLYGIRNPLYRIDEVKKDE
jgi:hypothetical protein